MKVSPPIQVKRPLLPFTSISLSQISHTTHQQPKSPSSGTSTKHSLQRWFLFEIDTYLEPAHRSV